MIGGLFAGTEEAPGEVNCSRAAATRATAAWVRWARWSKGSKDRYFQDASDADKLVPEGIEGACRIAAR
jgi:IMP dehydrogenase